MGRTVTRPQRALSRTAASVVVAALALAGVGLSAAPASAASFEVTSTADSGAGSLRAAITAANGSAGPDTITFQAGLGDILITSGPLVVTEGVTFDGPGSADLSIVRQGSFPLVTVDIDPAATAFDVEFNGLDFIGNSILDTGLAIEFIANDPEVDDITLSDTTFGGFANDYEGGAVSVFGATGNLTISDSTFVANSTPFPGGALYVETLVGTVRITGTTFESNESFYGGDGSAPEGGAIYIDSAAGIDFTDSVFTDNRTDGVGGAIAIDTIGTNSFIDLVTFSGNSAGLSGSIGNYGGAIYLGEIVTGAELVISRTSILGSTLVEGTLESYGAGPYVTEIGGTLTIDSSTFAGGDFTGDATPLGAGLSIALCSIEEGGELTVIDSTFDEASENGEYAIHACNMNGELNILYSTLVAPGVLFVNNNNGSTFVTSSILDAETEPDAIIVIDGNLVDVSWSLFSTPNNPFQINNLAGNRFSVADPKLGPLQNNGGPTPTRLPLPGSPALDQGDPAVTGQPLWDQRGAGFPRVDGRIDIGAIEVPRVLPNTGQAWSPEILLAGVLLIVAGLGLALQARGAIRRRRTT